MDAQSNHRQITADPNRIAEALFAEKAILGTMILDPEAYKLVIAKLDPDTLYDPQHKRIYFAAVDHVNAGLPLDFIAIMDRLAPIQFDVLADLADHAMYGSIEYWIDKVKAAAGRRYAQTMLQEAMADVGNFDTDLVARFKNMSDEVVKLIAPRSGVGNMSDGIVETLKNIQARQNTKIVKTGLQSLDMLVGGFQPGQLWVIAGRTSMGKSSLAQNMLLSAAKAGHAVGYVSIEGNNDELRQRLLAIESGISIGDIASANITDGGYARITSASARLSGLPILYVDRETIWSKVKAKIQLLKFEDPRISVVFVDYLGLIQNPQYRNRWEAVGAVTAEMKNLAQSLGLAIVAVCQINRETEKRKDHRPTLADLRDAGSVEQDADVILLLYRPAYYDKLSDSEDCQIAIAKQRNGPTGHVEVKFDGRCVKFWE